MYFARGNIVNSSPTLMHPLPFHFGPVISHYRIISLTVFSRPPPSPAHYLSPCVLVPLSPYPLVPWSPDRCSIASLAEFPEMIVDLFQPDSREVKANGCYNILLCESGFWQNYTVDDQFPCDPESGNPLFASGHKNEIWVQLLEKVYAKACGSYKRCVSCQFVCQSVR